MSVDDIPLKPKDEDSSPDSAPQAWSLQRQDPTPPPPPPKVEPKAKPVTDSDEDADGPLFDEASSLLDEFKTILGDRRCSKRLGPRILKVLYPLMMLGFAPFFCAVFEMAILKHSGLIAAVMIMPVTVALFFIQLFLYRVGFEMAYTILNDRK
jgi:hypothetical protein